MCFKLKGLLVYRELGSFVLWLYFKFLSESLKKKTNRTLKSNLILHSTNTLNTGSEWKGILDIWGYKPKMTHFSLFLQSNMGDKQVTQDCIQVQGIL